VTSCECIPTHYGPQVACVGASKLILYLLRDEFTTDRAAGFIDGTDAEPGPGTRTVNDTADNLTISGGNLLADVGVAYGDPRLVYPSINRKQGRLIVGAMEQTGAADVRSWIGWSSSATPGNSTSYSEGAFGLTGSIGIGMDGTGRPYVVPWVRVGLPFQAIASRAAGYFHFARVDYVWRLVYLSDDGATSPLYPAFSHSNLGGDKGVGYMAVPEPTCTPIPVASDSFNRANGALGTTDGNGHAEANGGAGVSWTTQVGTVGVDGNAAVCSALVGGVGIATVDCGLHDVLLSAVPTIGSSSVGLVLRYVDANNYIRFRHDGANAIVERVIGGVPTVLATVAKAYAAGAPLMAHMYMSNLVCTYRSTSIIYEPSVFHLEIQNSTEHGIWFADTDSEIDNFSMWASGTDDEYYTLENYIPAQPATTESRIMITFDDSMLGVYTNAFPYMEAHGIKGTVYATHAFVVGGPPAVYMTESQLGDLYDAGWDIGQHGYTHTDFTTMTQAQIETDLLNSRAWLEGLGFTRSSRHVAYPNGGYNATVAAAMAAENMYTGRLSDNNAQSDYTVDHYEIHSASIDAGPDSGTLVPSRLFPPVQRRLIGTLLMHGVDPGELEPLVDLIADRGWQTATVSEVYSYM